MTFCLSLIRKYWILTSLLLCVAITFLSLTPLAKLPTISGGDKLHHFVAYGALVLPLALRKPRYWFVVFAGFALLSGMIELLQPQVNRHAAWLDMLANLGGLVFGVAIAYLINHFFPEKAHSEDTP